MAAHGLAHVYECDGLHEGEDDGEAGLGGAAVLAESLDQPPLVLPYDTQGLADDDHRQNGQDDHAKDG